MAYHFREMYDSVGFSSILPLARYMLWLVHLSQVGVLSKWQNESRWVFGTGTSTNPAMCRVKIRLSRKIKVLLPGTSSQTRDLENFVTASRNVVSSTKLVDGRACGQHL